jgi:sec-independent protein translocase protein TatA
LETGPGAYTNERERHDEQGANLWSVFGDILQPTHLIFILVVALLVLGPKRLPEVGRSLGKGIRDFRGALSGLDDETSDLRSTMTGPLESPPPAPVTPATVTPDETVSSEAYPEAVATQVMATPSPAPDTVPLDPHAAETAAVDAARVTAGQTAAHADPEHAAESAAGEHAIAAPSGEAPASPDVAPGVKPS